MFILTVCSLQVFFVFPSVKLIVTISADLQWSRLMKKINKKGGLVIVVH